MRKPYRVSLAFKYSTINKKIKFEITAAAAPIIKVVIINKLICKLIIFLADLKKNNADLFQN